MSSYDEDFGFEFDADSEAPSRRFELLAAGTYPAEIVEAKIKPYKTAGRGVNFAWVICEGEYEARQVFQLVTIEHPNETAQKIGRGMMKDICVACDVTGMLTSL